MRNTVLEATTLQDKKMEIIEMGHHEDSEGKVFILIEGTDDEKIYRHFLNEQKVIFYVTKSCLYVVELLRILKTNPYLKNKVIGVKDADFDHILHRSYPDLDNLFLTDYHDIEMTLLSVSEGFENSLQAECSLQTTTPLVEKVAKDLKSLSYLRLYNEVTVANNELEGIELDGINFNDITYSALYDGENAITWEQCLGHVKSTCNNSRLEHYPTTEMIKLFANSYINPNLKQLTRGHDLVFALQVRLQKLNRKNSLGYKDLCLILRNTCPKEKFEETNLYHQLNEWMNQQGRYLWHNKVA